MSKERDHVGAIGSYIAGVIANVAVLWLVNKAPDWDLPFLTDSYDAVLWALNLSILVQIAGNLILLVFHPRMVHYLIQATFGVFTVLALIVLAAVYPFDFAFLAGFVNTIVLAALVVGAVGTAVGVVVSILRAIGSLFRRDG